jgi:hypothetical protein
MKKSFATSLGFAEAARLKSSLVEQQSERPEGEWVTAWDDMFIEEAQSTPRDEIAQRYKTLMHRFAAEVGGPRPAD